MAPRPSWHGYLKLSLVTCPVAMLPATSEADKVRFHTLNRATGNLQFAEMRTPSKLFDGGSVHVAGGEIHFPKVAAVSQHAIDEVYTFENFRPIHIGHITHACDDIADGRVGCDLSLLFIVDWIFCIFSAANNSSMRVSRDSAAAPRSRNR